MPGDVRKYDLCCAGVDKVVAKYGRLDFLINNAAGNFMVSAENLTPNGLATVLGIDLQGCAYGVGIRFHVAVVIVMVVHFLLLLTFLFLFFYILSFLSFNR